MKMSLIFVHILCYHCSLALKMFMSMFTQQVYHDFGRYNELSHWIFRVLTHFLTYLEQRLPPYFDKRTDLRKYVQRKWLHLQYSIGMKKFLNTIVYPPSLPETQFSQNYRTTIVFIDHFQHLLFWHTNRCMDDAFTWTCIYRLIDLNEINVVVKGKRRT